MTTLCERCFPGWRDAEVLTMPPLIPCQQCGSHDNRIGRALNGAATRCHVFRTDPRKPRAALLRSSQTETKQ